MTRGEDAERIAELEQDNDRLRRLLDQRDAPGELRHRLRSTLSLLRSIVRATADSGRDLPGYVAHLEDRLDAIARAQAQADQHGEVDLKTLLADELLHYGASEGDRLLLSGPDVRLRPRAGQVLALAFHECAVNAVEHGGLGTNEGRLEASWNVTCSELEPSLVFRWIEFGSKSDIGSDRQGFGTQVLTRMLPYELRATTEITFAPSGLRCTIHLALPGSIGRVVSS